MSIATQIQALTADRTAIQNAISAKGGTVSSADGFDDFASAIATIPSGGGSSDFATCTVTFTEQWDEDWIIYVPWANDLGSTGDMDAVIFLGAGQTVTVQCVLYKGLAVGSFPDDSRPSTGTITTTGGVSYDEDANFINITGDGTLTIG